MSSPSISRSALFVTAVAAATLVHAVTAPATAPPVAETVSSKPSAEKKRARPEVYDARSTKKYAVVRDLCEDVEFLIPPDLRFSPRLLYATPMSWDVDNMCMEAKVDKELDELKAKYEHDVFRRGAKKQLQSMRGIRWFNICRHNKTLQCNPCDREAKIARGEPIILEEPLLNPDVEELRIRFKHRQFRIGPRSGKAQALFGVEWKDVCGHCRYPPVCKACDGSALCINHEVQGCVQCDKTLYCECKRRRHLCPIHGGTSICAKTGKLVQHCLCCEGSYVCPKCKERLIKKDGLCKRCHPNFVETDATFSKSACRFMDEMEIHLGLKLQHRHLDLLLGEKTGSEHVIKEWRRKRVDGFNEEKNIIVEFLGDDVHGHPSLWENNYEREDRNGFRMEDNYYDTYEKMGKLKAFGYRVLYAWEADIDRRTGKSVLPGVYREFIQDLEW